MKQSEPLQMKGANGLVRANSTIRVLRNKLLSVFVGTKVNLTKIIR